MLIIWGIIWGVMAIIGMWAAIYLYPPKASGENQIIISKWTTSIRYGMLIIAMGAFWGVWCGYVAALHAISLLGMLKMTLVFGVLSCSFVTDLLYMRIPNFCPVILCAGQAVFALFEFITQREEALYSLLDSIFALLISFVLLLFMSKITKGGIGAGDIKLFCGIGFLCGIQALCYILVLSFLVCAIMSTILLALGKKRLKDSIPLGPAIWWGYGIAVLLALI